MHCSESALLHDLLSSELGTLPQATLPDRRVDGVVKDPTTFAKEYLMYNLVRKREPFVNKADVPTSVLRDSLTAFAEAEHQCLVINTYGSMWSPIVKDDTVFFAKVLHLARQWIADTLVDVWPKWDDARYTSGASRNCSRSRSLAPLKWVGVGDRNSKQLSATPLALRIAETYIAPTYAQNWARKGYEIVSDSKFDFVQKTAKAVRFMAMEPEINMLTQKCVGDAIRFALLQRGINLNSQLLNQQLAMLGSIFGTRATLDQTSASDCIAVLMANMLPKRYKEWVLDTRTPYTTVDNHTHKLQKIATMGNGFIFELQSLIFAAFTFACTALTGGRECDIAIYGDDIVCSSCTAPSLMRSLEFYGLIPNMTKSFWDVTEPFRESCGKHYFAGRDVTPFFIKKSLDTLQAKFRAYNGLRYWSERTGIKIPDTLRYLVSLIDKKDRVLVPPSYSIDSGLHFPVSDCIFPIVRLSHGQSRARFKYWRAYTYDVTRLLNDNVRYQDWLLDPPPAIISLKLWDVALRKICLRPRSRVGVRQVLPGIPREVRRYCVGLPDDRVYRWSDSSIARSEIP
ncbi:MAG: putative replicase protein [Pepevirus faecenecus]|uniref:RNA-directed RNA polymerase n=1 Tax=Leviviridae sp. TaxID=2027243 RepID=A0ABY3SU55_9VIRU|nr:MAG: putative replicase protein [Leviviridae sp.]